VRFGQSNLVLGHNQTSSTMSASPVLSGWFARTGDSRPTRAPCSIWDCQPESLSRNLASSVGSYYDDHDHCLNSLRALGAAILADDAPPVFPPPLRQMGVLRDSQQRPRAGSSIKCNYSCSFRITRPVGAAGAMGRRVRAQGRAVKEGAEGGQACTTAWVGARRTLVPPTFVHLDPVDRHTGTFSPSPFHLSIHARVNPAPSPGRTHVSRPRQWAPNSQPESFSILAHRNGAHVGDAVVACEAPTLLIQSDSSN
jgi:hypothetical protein